MDTLGITYDHILSTHIVQSPRVALPQILEGFSPNSLLDVGCGLGAWLKASLEFGIKDVFGVDGVQIPQDKLLVPSHFVIQQDLRIGWDLGRKFDVVLCLEVAEHLEENCANGLIQALAMHSDLVFFSAACPGQPGQNHVNCQWPKYWQNLFNSYGYVCSDAVRWRIWNDSRIEPWYRQNLFSARRNPVGAGNEERIQPVIHPELLPFFEQVQSREVEHRILQGIREGSLPAKWYLDNWMRASAAKAKRLVRRKFYSR